MGQAFLIKKADGSFLPAFDSDYEVMKRVKVGDPIEITWRQPRNYLNHKRFFALLNCTISNMSDKIPQRYQNIDYLRYEVLIACGYATIHETLGGKMFYEPKSMSFKSMNETEFNVLYSLVSAYILKYFLPDLDEKTFEANLKLFL